MSVANLWKLSAVVFNNGSSTAQISSIVDQNLDPQIEDVMEGGSGTLDTEFAAVMQAKPMLEFTTTALASALAIVGLNAFAITSQTDFYFQKINQGGTIASGSNHIKVAATKGIICPKTIEAAQNEVAKIVYGFYAISTDGSTAPLAVSTGQALPTITPVDEMFTVGPVTINGSNLAAVQRLSVDFGIQTEIVGSDGNAYPTFAGVVDRQPIITVGGLDMTALSTFNINGIALSTWKAYFRKIAEGGTRVADGTAEHVKLSGTTGLFRPGGVRGSNRQPLEGDWQIKPTFDGTNDVIQISTGSTIT